MGDTSVATVNRHYFNFDEDTLREIIEGWAIPEVPDVYGSRVYAALFLASRRPFLRRRSPPDLRSFVAGFFRGTLAQKA